MKITIGDLESDLGLLEGALQNLEDDDIETLHGVTQYVYALRSDSKLPDVNDDAETILKDSGIIK